MPGNPLFYRARIRNAADSADDLVITSLSPAGTNPYLTAAPSGDGASLNIITGQIQQGALQIRLADAVTSGPAVRVLTSILADAVGRWQLIGRICVVEESVDGTSWTAYARGVLKRLTLVTAMEWSLTLGDVNQAEATYIAFATATTAFPKVVNIIGEPITGGWGPIAAIGQTIFKVTFVTAKRVRLTYQNGPLPPDYVNRRSADSSHYATATKLARPFAVLSDQWWNEDHGVGAYFPRLQARLTNPTSGALTGTFTPIAHSTTGMQMVDPQGYWGWDWKKLLNNVGELWLDWPSGGSPAQPALNTLFAVRVSPIDVSDLNPMHVEGHPVDIWTALYTEAGIPWSAAAATALKALLGDTLRYRGRFTAGAPLGDLMAKEFGGPLGIGVRVAADGTRELISVRDLPTAIPGTIITVNDLRNDTGAIFDLNDEGILKRVTWATAEFDKWNKDRDGGEQPNDLIVVSPVVYATVNGDTGAPNGNEQKYQLAGHFYDSRAAQSFQPVPFFAAQALRIFDRFGRGNVLSEVQVLRGIAPKIGEFVVLNLPHLPVPIQGAVPVTQRGQGLRVVQVIGGRPNPEGPILKVLDAGRNAQPSVSPTISVAASARDAKHYAEVTVTNVGAMVGIIERVNFQMGTGSSAPSGGIDFAARSLAELAVNAVVPLPKVAAGEKVWVRAQSKDSQQNLPSPWTAWISVTLTALTAPSGVTVVAGANDTEKIIRWSLPDTEGPVRIRWKLTGDADWIRTVTLPPNTVEYTITDLIPGGGGISGEVARIDDPPSPGESAASTFSFTPGSSSPSLPVPWSPAGWAGAQDNLSPAAAVDIDGSFGLDVTAAKWPAFIEVEVAVETAVGSGAYGTYALAANPLVLQGYRTRTRFTFWAPNDRLRRKMRARHVLPGYTSSSYTAEVVVSPWVAQKAIIPAISPPTFAVSGKVTGTIENPTAYLLVLYATPDNPHFDYVRYRVRQRTNGSSTWGEETIVIGGRDGDDLIPVQFGVQAEVRLDVVNTDGVIDSTATPLVVNTPKFPKAELWQFAADGTFGGMLGPAQIAREPARLVVGFVPNEHTVLVEVYSEEHTVDPGDPRSLNDGRLPEKVIPVEPAVITIASGGVLVGSPEVVGLPLSASGNFRLISFVPYDRLGRVGTIVNFKQSGDATALPSAPSAASNVSLPGAGSTAPQTLRNSVTPTSSVNTIRLYRNGRFYKDFGPGTSGVPMNDDNPAISAQVDRWEYCHYTGTPALARESARTAMFVTTTPTLKLAAVASFAVRIPGSPTPPSPQDVVIDSLAWTSNNPLDTQAILRRAPDVAGAPGAWTEVATLLPFQDGVRYTPGSGLWWFSILFRRTDWTDSNASQQGPFPYP